MTRKRIAADKPAGDPAAEPLAGDDPIRDRLKEILAGYREAKRRKGVNEPSPTRAALGEAHERFQESEPVRAHPQINVKVSAGVGGWADVPWIAFLDRRETSTTQRGIMVMLLFRADMSGVYLTLMQGITDETKQLGRKAARDKLRERAAALRPTLAALAAKGFHLDGTIELRGTAARPLAYEASAIAHKLYSATALPDDRALLADLGAALDAYDGYVVAHPRSPFDRAAALAELTAAIAARGFVFEPWQVAAYVTALRTKPFVILAGVSGTGKSRLPALVAELTGGRHALHPVRPDWTDSSDVLGYSDLRGRFRPGWLLQLAEAAAARPALHHVAIVDEMNLARVEQYFAEVLSRIEDRREVPGGGFASGPLLSQPLDDADARWADVTLPANLALVGTVNMDETTHGFSRKVLDRAFSLEISDIDLSTWEPVARGEETPRKPWPPEAFRPRALRLGALAVTAAEAERVREAVAVLGEVNAILGRAQLQVGYRVRDEVALFLLHADEVVGAFKTRLGVSVDPLDLALVMKILPRIAGGSASSREVVAALLGWASQERRLFKSDEEAASALSRWKDAGRPSSMTGARYPRMAARLSLMHERLLADGYTSFWA